MLPYLLAVVYVTVSARCTLHVDPRRGSDTATGLDINQPLLTLHEANRRQRTMSGNIDICLEPGVHPLNGQALHLTPGKPTTVTWRPRIPGTQSIVSGGIGLTKWYPCNEGGRCPGWTGVWVHYMTDAHGLKPDMIPVRQLWVNGSRATRSFIEGSTLNLKVTPTGYSSTTPLYFADDAAKDQVELLWPKVIRNWIQPRCILTAATSTSMTVAPECWKNLTTRNQNKLPPPPTYIENVVHSGGPGPGEFYATPLYVFYRPPNPFPTTHVPTDAWVPGQETIVSSEGVKGHKWQGITFQYSTWRQPSAPGGYVPVQSTVNDQGEPLGSVSITKSSNITFDSCTFQHMGGAYGLSIGGGSQGVTVVGCNFRDLSGGALKLGNIDKTRAVSKNQTEWDTDMLAQHCTVEGCGKEFQGAAAIFAGYVAHTTIDHNTIQSTGYTGISLGWGWGVVSYARDNHVTGNRLHNIMSALNDGGCIYTLSPQPGSTVSHNYCKTDYAPVVGEYYHDNGSRYFNTTNNVAEGSPAPCVYLQGYGTTASDIYVADLWYKGTAPPRNGCVKEHCVINAATVHQVTGAWPSAAQAIIDASGAHPQ